MKVKVAYLAVKEVEVNVIGLKEKKMDDYGYMSKIISKIEKHLEKKDKGFYEVVSVEKAENGEMFYEK